MAGCNGAGHHARRDPGAFSLPVSRAFARELAAASPDVLRRLSEQRFLIGADGRLIQEGEPLAQIELAALISQIRQRGAGVLYAGPLARDLVAASKAPTQSSC